MGIRSMNSVIQYIRRLAREDEHVRTDGELLNAFVQMRDEGALTVLVERHGPMVWGVCRRLLRAHQDAEDAFQATFLVLVRKAASLRDRDAVANWLHGVAHQTAVRVRATLAKQYRRERQAMDMPEPAVEEVALPNDLLPFLDEELTRLPDKYRVLIVLCDLEGKSRKEAARQLGCPEGTIGGRLARARAMLAKRLARHGLAVSSGSLAAGLAQTVASAGVPASVVTSTIRVATLLAAGKAAGVISTHVASLTEGVLKTMYLNKIMTTVIVTLALAGGVVIHGALAQRQSEDKVPTAEKPMVKPPTVAKNPMDAAVNPEPEKKRVYSPEDVERMKIDPKSILIVQFRVNCALESSTVKLGPKYDSWVCGHAPGDLALLPLGVSNYGQKHFFCAILTANAIGQLKRLGIQDVRKHFEGKTLRVSGAIATFPFSWIQSNKIPTDNDFYELIIDDISQCEVVN
jgi:RNA polymerase sigma factor (sigma-70 family)